MMTPEVKPILFSGPMVRALLDGRKTQTRRVLPQPPEHITSAGVFSSNREGVTDNWSWLSGDPRDADTWEFEGDFHTRYRPGQLRYVREAWRTHSSMDDVSPKHLKGIRFWFEADDGRKPTSRVRASMHLPRWASRITLEVGEVRVQRLQEISEEDAGAEGVYETEWYDRAEHVVAGGAPWSPERLAFADLWNSINAKPRPIYAPDANGKKGIIGYVSYPWEAGRRVETYRDRPHQVFGNPWVAAVSFEAHQQNVDDFLKARAS